MELAFFYGPDKIPFRLKEKGMVESDSAIPFHGIISRGLLAKFIKEGLTNQTWYKYSHLIGQTALENQEPDLIQLQEYARECGVLSFGHSTTCVKLFIENYCNDLITEDNAQCEIWNIKEGHTSSVWKISIFDSNSKEHHFIINVARDYEAGIELKTTSEQMIAIAEHCPNTNMAKVYEIQKILLNYNDNLFEVIVTRNEWIKDSYEIHTVKDTLNEKEKYLLVERFLTKEDTPSQITSIYGRRFSEEESIKIKADIDFFLNNASSRLSPTPTLNINDGDVVWNGERAIVIAVS